LKLLFIFFQKNEKIDPQHNRLRFELSV